MLYLIILGNKEDIDGDGVWVSCEEIVVSKPDCSDQAQRSIAMFNCGSKVQHPSVVLLVIMYEWNSDSNVFSTLMTASFTFEIHYVH